MKTYVKIITTLVFAGCVLLLASCNQYSGSNRAPFPAQPKQIALLLPLHGPYANAGKAVRDGFFAAYYDNAQANDNRLTTIRVYDTASNKNMRALYRNAVANGADLVVGPIEKNNVNQLASGYLNVPVLALNYLPNNKSAPKNLYEFGLSPENEAALAASKAYNNNHQQALIIYPQTKWGNGVAEAYANQWQNLGGTITASLAYGPGQNLRSEIKNLLHIDASEGRANKLKHVLNEKFTYVPQRRQDVDTIFLVATPSKAREIVPLLRFYYAGNIPIYSISTIYQGIPKASYYRDMNGVYFCDIPWVLTDNSGNNNLQKAISKNWPSTYKHNPRLYALGLDAYKLSYDFNRLAMNGSARDQGATGDLVLENHRVFRQLRWAQFQDGLPKELNA